MEGQPDMSGGSFNYLHGKRGWELLTSDHDLEEMVEYLKDYAPKSRAYKYAKKQLKAIRKIKKMMPDINWTATLLDDVFKAVEWRVSNDRSHEHMLAEIEKFEVSRKLYEPAEKIRDEQVRKLFAKTKKERSGSWY